MGQQNKTEDTRKIDYISIFLWLWTVCMVYSLFLREQRGSEITQVHNTLEFFTVNINSKDNGDLETVETGVETVSTTAALTTTTPSTTLTATSSTTQTTKPLLTETIQLQCVQELWPGSEIW